MLLFRDRIMIDAWTLRTPLGTYRLRLHPELPAGLGVEGRARRETLWFFARVELMQVEPRAVSDAMALYERLQGAPPPSRPWGQEREWMRAIVHHLEIAVRLGHLDFERLPDAQELPAYDDVDPASRPFDPRPLAEHWIDLEILDEETREPVAGMVVTLKLADGSVTRKTTDASGRIHVEGQPQGRWEILDVEEPVEVVGLG